MDWLLFDWFLVLIIRAWNCPSDITNFMTVYVLEFAILLSLIQMIMTRVGLLLFLEYE